MCCFRCGAGCGEHTAALADREKVDSNAIGVCFARLLAALQRVCATQALSAHDALCVSLAALPAVNLNPGLASARERHSLTRAAIFTR